MAKNVKEKVQLPHIYRIFTAARKNPLRPLILAILVIITYLLLLEILNLTNNYFGRQREAGKEKTELMREKISLQKIVDKYPDFRDGYYKLAEVEYQLNNEEGAKWYIQKVLELDPNFELAILFKRKLDRKSGQ